MGNKGSIYVVRRKQGGYALRLPGSTRASAVYDCESVAVDRAFDLYPGRRVYVESGFGVARDRWREVVR